MTINSIRNGVFNLRDRDITQIFIPEQVSSIFDGKSFNRLVIFKTRNGFTNCSKLTSCIIICTIKKLPKFCFHSCPSLIEAVLPASLTSLLLGCFSHCKSLSSLSLHEGISEFGENCFEGCRSLT